MEPTIWESADHKITFVHGDGCNIKLDGETTTIIIKDTRENKNDVVLFFSGVLVGALIGAAITIIASII